MIRNNSLLKLFATSFVTVCCNVHDDSCYLLKYLPLHITFLHYFDLNRQRSRVRENRKLSSSRSHSRLWV